MSVNHEQLKRLVDEMEQGTAATTKYSWLDLAHEVLRMQQELGAMRHAWLSLASDPDHTSTAQNFAMYVVDHIDSVLGENNE